MNFDEITPAELNRQIDAGEPWQLLDVREDRELEQARVAFALHIPMADVPARQGELDSQRPVAVLCHSGGRSARVAQFLVASGFERVANVSGGIDAWSLDVDRSVPRY